MKHFIGLGICATLLVSCGDDKKEQSAESTVTEAPALDLANPDTKLNYAIGMGAGISFEETMAQLKLDGGQVDSKVAFEGFSDHLNGTSSMGLDKCQEVVGTMYQKVTSQETLSDEELNDLSYAQGVMFAEGALRKMAALNVSNKLNKQAMITGAEHQFNDQPTAISKEDMQEFLANLEKDRSEKATTPSTGPEPITVVGSIDDYEGSQQASYVVGMNNGLNLSQNIGNLSPEFGARINLEKLVEIVDNNFGKNIEIDNAEYQQNMQAFFNYEKNPSDMPQEVEDKFTTSIGYTIVQSIETQAKSFNIDKIDKESFMDGLSGVLLRNEAKMTVADHDNYLTDLAKKRGEDFLAANAKKPGVKVTASGLQYKVLKSGTGGRKPTPNDRVKVHYHGTLIDGTVFDSSVERGEPTEFGVTQVIKGWIEGLQLMSVGDKFEFYIPQELAYGANPRPGGVIKPYDALVFQVELIEIK